MLQRSLLRLFLTEIEMFLDILTEYRELMSARLTVAWVPLNLSLHRSVLTDLHQLYQN